MGYTLINIIRPEIFVSNLIPDILSSLDAGLTVGNSARLIRSTAAIILAIIVLLGSKLLFKLSDKSQWVRNHFSVIMKVLAAFFAGIMILWSNDYGVASYISFSFIYLCIVIKKYKAKVTKIVVSILLYIGVSVIGLIIALLVITRGNPSSWFEFTYGVSSSQSWYYGLYIQEKSFFLYNFDFSYLTLFILMLTIFYLYKFFRLEYSKRNIIRYGIPAFLLLSGFIAANIYKLMSGTFLREGAYLILLLIITSESFYIIKNVMEYYSKLKLRINSMIVLLLFSLSFCLYTGISEALKQHSGEYFDSLKGYITGLAPSLNLAEERIGSSRIFSTYASAVEVITNQFQPSGSDYIIHVLGDKQRQRYLNSFTKADFKYAVSIRSSYTPWEYWIRNANWYFYRELYNRYTPEFVTDYEMFWKKSEDANVFHPSLTTEIEKLDDHSYRIVIKTDDPTISGTADVSISYSTVRNESFLTNLAYNSMIYVMETSQKKCVDKTEYCNFFIPPNHDNYYIPVTILDGVGEVVLVSCPGTGYSFNLKRVRVEGVFMNPFNYLFLSNLTDENWHNGINRYERIFLLQNTIENQYILARTKKLKATNGVCITVSGIETVDPYIRVYYTENIDATAFAYPNKIEVLK